MAFPNRAALAMLSAIASSAILLPSSGCDRSGEPPRRAIVVIDGDTLEVDGHIVDLPGIDAPELGQQCLQGTHLYDCGRNAAFDLNKQVMLEGVTCVPGTPTSSGYECQTAEGAVSLLLVREGLVVARSEGELKSAEEQARQVPMGIWRGTFVDPADWRAGRRLPQEQQDPKPCPVLGLNVDGADIYVVPTDPDYEALFEAQASVAEHFCSDEEARASAYRHGRPSPRAAEDR